MANRTQRLQFVDGCANGGCIVDEVRDEDNALVSYTVVRKCSAHSGVADGRLRAAALSDDTTRNYVHLALLGTSSIVDVGVNLGRDDGSGGREFQNGTGARLSYRGTGESRVLEVTMTGRTLTTLERTTIQSAMDLRFGIGRVEVL